MALARRDGGNWTRVCNDGSAAALAEDVDCVRPEWLPADRYRLTVWYRLTVYGYVMPVLVLLTVVTNCLVCAVLGATWRIRSCAPCCCGGR